NRGRRRRIGRRRSGRSLSKAADRYALHRELQHGTGSRRFYRVRARDEILSGDGPSVAPQERLNLEHTDAAAIEIRLVVERELLHIVAEIQQAEMAGADLPAARSGEQLAAAFQHVDAHVVEIRAGDLA